MFRTLPKKIGSAFLAQQRCWFGVRKGSPPGPGPAHQQRPSSRSRPCRQCSMKRPPPRRDRGYRGRYNVSHTRFMHSPGHLQKLRPPAMLPTGPNPARGRPCLSPPETRAEVEVCVKKHVPVDSRTPRRGASQGKKPSGASVLPDSAHLSSEMSDPEPAGVRLPHYSGAAPPGHW